MYPFMVLDVPHDVDDDTVRRRYEQLTAEFSPEQSPEMFGLVQRAYEQIKDARGRVQARLFYFDNTGDELTTEVSLWLELRPTPRMSRDELGDFLRRLE